MTSHPLAYYHPRSVEPLRPPNPFLSFYRQANRMFEDIFREFDEAREALGGTFTPNVDVTQDDHQIRITAELPGIREEDIDVSIKNDLLTIRAEKRVEQDGAGENRQVKERAFGKFERTFRLPEAVEPDRIRAHFTHGLLTIILPGADQEKGERKIAIDPSPAPANRPEANAKQPQSGKDRS
ncbi:Hsp20/alpha crystallin family protein [Novosphingobium sp. SG707]|uniref:Hsp20/alpha crystallin family protein n=1 Tax=Novosphingobium sp. SG707 TaxID=2586996 RepID=UPI001446036D|nr:Hsp20/alpha crystallin family protein [Novosphingobium sp. SG707]NKJ01696.1 HSP20 family protein [Novosphingobium sp. SG707]